MSKILKLKKVNTLKLAYITATIYSILALCIFLIVAIFGIAFQSQGFGFIFVIIMPVVYGIAGFISGLISGALYNKVSKWIGGLEFEVEEIEKFSE